MGDGPESFLSAAAVKLPAGVPPTSRMAAGVAPNKFVAKLASDLEKPDGLVVVESDAILDFLSPLPIGRLWGVGPATLPAMERMGIGTFGDLRGISEGELRNRFGEAGEHFYRLVRGIDDRAVVPDREAKSISHEITFPIDIADRAYLRATLLDLTDQVARRLRLSGQLAKTVTLKLRTADFKTITRGNTLEAPVDGTDPLWTTAVGMFESWARECRSRVRLIGVGVSRLGANEGQQMSLFDERDDTRRRELDKTLDRIRDRYGHDSLSRGTGPPMSGREP